MAELPKGLQQVLERIFHRELAARMGRVMTAAAKSIEQLQAINLVSLEPSTADEGTADLALWEQMAPAVADTMASVNGLCAVIDREFPASAARSGRFSTEGSDERAETEAALVFQAVAAHLKKEIAQVREMVRRPELMGSRWALLEELHRLRADFRRRVGDAVHLAAASTGQVQREEVVPGASREAQRALVYRATTSELVVTIRQRLASELPLPELREALASDLQLFSSLPAWKHLNARPKRHLLRVKELCGGGALERETLAREVEALLDDLEDVATELTNEVLVSHDLTVVSQANFRLEQARLHLKLETGAATWAFEAAIALLEELRGRDREFDRLVRRLRDEVEQGAEVSLAELEALRVALRQLEL